MTNLTCPYTDAQLRRFLFVEIVEMDVDWSDEEIFENHRAQHPALASTARHGIVRDGVALYEEPGHLLERPKKLKPVEALKEAQGYFNDWYPSAETYFRNAVDNVERQRPKEAAFLFHQATERLYHCVLLVLRGYSPKSHKLNFLRSQCEQLDAQLAEAWARGSRPEQRCFYLLRRAYVDARYSPHYKIKGEELAWLGEQVGVLQRLVGQICDERLAVLRSEAG